MLDIVFVVSKVYASFLIYYGNLDLNFNLHHFYYTEDSKEHILCPWLRVCSYWFPCGSLVVVITGIVSKYLNAFIYATNMRKFFLI